MGLPAKIHSPQPFPRKDLEATACEWWDRQVEDLRLLADPIAELQPDSGTVFDLVPVVSSHQAIELVLELEKIVGYKIPDKVVKRGGYHSRKELVDHMLPRLSDFHDKQQ